MIVRFSTLRTSEYERQEMDEALVWDMGCVYCLALLSSLEYQEMIVDLLGLLCGHLLMIWWLIRSADGLVHVHSSSLLGPVGVV